MKSSHEMKTIKYNKLLSRLIITNAISATVVWIIFLLYPPRGITLFKIAWSWALFYGGFAITTVLQYNNLSKRIDKGKYKESDFLFWWERIKMRKELPQEKQSEESDTPES